MVRGDEFGVLDNLVEASWSLPLFADRVGIGIPDSLSYSSYEGSLQLLGQVPDGSLLLVFKVFDCVVLQVLSDESQVAVFGSFQCV